MHGYDVVEKREYPELDHLNEIDAVIVSGSFVDDACEDKPWIFLNTFLRIRRLAKS